MLPACRRRYCAVQRPLQLRALLQVALRHCLQRPCECLQRDSMPVSHVSRKRAPLHPWSIRNQS